MNGPRQTWLVAAREIRERCRSRAFVASLLLMLLAVAGTIVLPALLGSGAEAKDVGLTGATPAGLGDALRAQGTAVDTTIRIRAFPDLEHGEAAVRDGEVDVLVVDARRLEWRKQADEQLQAVVTGAIQLLVIRDRAEAAGIDPGELLAVVEPVAISNVELGRIEGRGPDDETAALLMTLVLFFAISTYGAMVLSGVVEEKSSRTVEVLLARMPARNLLAGKIAGIGLLGLAQVAATAIVALVAAALADSVDIPAVRASVIAWAVLWFILGYALYATVFGALGSLASRTEDTSTISGPVSIILVLAFMASFATVGSADTTWARLVAWFPVTAPLAMPNRIAMGAATWWDPLLGVAFTVAAIAGLVVLGGRVYTRAILHTGATLSLGQAWRGAAGPAHEVDEVAVVAQPTPRTDRRLFLLVLTATAIGGAVVALTGDVAMGVAVGAVTIGVGRQALRSRGPSRRDAGAADGGRR